MKKSNIFRCDLRLNRGGEAVLYPLKMLQRHIDVQHAIAVGRDDRCCGVVFFDLAGCDHSISCSSHTGARPSIASPRQWPAKARNRPAKARKTGARYPRSHQARKARHGPLIKPHQNGAWTGPARP